MADENEMPPQTQGYADSVGPMPDVPSAPSPVDNLVEDWWEQHVRGTVAVAATEGWNAMQKAKNALKKMLQGHQP